MLHQCDRHNLAIWQIMLENEKAWRSERQIRAYVQQIWEAMQECVHRGLVTEGILPGGLEVRRRAASLARKLNSTKGNDALMAMDWVNAFAMASHSALLIASSRVCP